MHTVRSEATVAIVLTAVIVGLLTAIGAMRSISSSVRPITAPADAQSAAADAADARERLLEKIHRQGDPDEPGSLPVAVSVAEFFAGNTDPNSIGRGLSPHPGLERFKKVLTQVAQRRNVQAVLVGIDQTSDDPNAWPVSSTVYVLAWAPRESVERWLAELKPEQVSEGYPVGGKPPAVPQLMEDARVYTAWWQ
jgi:hypothetical protein